MVDLKFLMHSRWWSENLKDAGSALFPFFAVRNAIVETDGDTGVWGGKGAVLGVARVG
jgi:hypothetical protein